MYNGIGLATARGSGTNAYVQKNLSFTNKVKQRVEYKTEEDIKKLDASVNRPANQAILAHQRKRQIELKCLEMREKMEEQGYADEEIDEKVAAYREALQVKAEEAVRQKEMLFKFDENGRPNVKETHQMAEINEERNNKLKNALRISPSFVEGSSLDVDRKSKELSKNEPQQQQKYNILEDTPSPESQKQVASKINIVEKKEKHSSKSDGKHSRSREKSKEKRVESDNDKPKKEVPKKYAYDNRKHKRSRSRSKSRDRYLKDYRRSSNRNSRYRSKRSRHDSESSRSSRERARQTESSRSSSYSHSSDSSSSSSSSSSQSSHNSSSSYSSRGKSVTRSPPIRRRRGSPNFLEKRRITSARKRPVPYHRRSPSSASDSLYSASSDESCFSSLSTVSRKRCHWRRSSHTSTTNSLTEIT